MTVKNQHTEVLEEARREEILRKLFPFQFPPQELIDGMYIIVDPEYQLRKALHQTNTSILTLQRGDGNFIVPAVGLNGNYPYLDLSFMGRETLPKTHAAGRRFASWWGAKPLKQAWRNETAYTPEREDSYLEVINEIHQLYSQIIQGEQVDEKKLEKLFSGFVSGAWLKYYAEELPIKIYKHDMSAIQEGRQVFAGYEERVRRAREKFETLTDGDKLLLRESFNFTIQARQEPPILYIDDDIPKTLNSGITERLPTDYRSPHEIVANTRGVTPNEVEALFFPNEIQGTAVERAAINRILALGIGRDRIRKTSELGEYYDNCQERYGHFSAIDLIELIKNRKFLHVFEADLETLLR